MGAERGGPWRAREEGSFLLGTMLWSVTRLRWLIEAFGLDYALFRELSRVRVLLALRRATTSSKAWGAAGAAIAILMTWFAGLGTGLMALMSRDASAWVVLSQSALMLLLVFLLFQHFAAILVDPTDIGVVAPHPVQDRTLFAVRLAEIAALLLVFVVTFTAGNVLLALFGKPPLAVLLVYPVLSLLCGALTLGLVALLFALCLRIVGPTHFQRVTLWAQILGGVLIFLGFQAPRMMHAEQWELLAEDLRELRFLWPPFQYAELFAFASGEQSVRLGPLLAAVLLPAAALALTFWLASRYFVAGLQGTLSAPRARSTWARGALSSFLWRAGGRLRDREERAGFEFTLALARREPHFLRAVLPQLLMFQVMSLGMGFGLRRDVGMFLTFSAGFLFMVLPNVLLQSQGTPAPDARELFASAPLENENALLRGGVKALLLQWIGLPALVVFGVQFLVVGPGVLPRSVLAFELAFAATLVFTRLFRLGVPFTQPIRVGSSGTANLGIILVMGLGMGILFGVHRLLSMHPLALGAGIAALVPLLILAWRGLSSLRVAADRRLFTKPSRLG
jgi:hypothetical protein